MQKNIRTIGSAIDKWITEPIVIKEFHPKPVGSRRDE